MTFIDEYGIKEYKLWFKIILAVSILYTYIFIVALPLYYSEVGAVGANIDSYRDAVWLLQMAASTIGFGDVYPVTETGKAIVAFSFYVGVGLAGYVGASIADAFTKHTDNSVQNRELRKQNEEILAILKGKEYEKSML
jgi:voltage-gated potassium channel